MRGAESGRREVGRAKRRKLAVDRAFDVRRGALLSDGRTEDPSVSSITAAVDMELVVGSGQSVWGDGRSLAALHFHDSRIPASSDVTKQCKSSYQSNCKFWANSELDNDQNLFNENAVGLVDIHVFTSYPDPGSRSNAK